MPKRGKNNLHYIYIALGFLVIAFLLYAFLRFYTSMNENKLANSIEADIQQLKQMDVKNNVCISSDEYEKLLQNVQCPKQNEQTQDNVSSSRDYKVLQDPLYPPLNRSDATTHNNLRAQIDQRNIYIPTNFQSHSDTYRVIGYLVNKEATQDVGGNNWKLFARQKDRNLADFYMIPANNNYDVKIQITSDMVVGEKLRDVYTVPNVVYFNSPMLNKSEYQFVELPKTDFTTDTKYI